MLSTFATHSHNLSSSLLLLRSFLIELLFRLANNKLENGPWHLHPLLCTVPLPSLFKWTLKCQWKMLLTHNCWSIYNNNHPSPYFSAPPAAPAGSFRHRLNNFVEDFIELNQFRMHVNAAAAQSSPHAALPASCCHWWCYTEFKARSASSFPALNGFQSTQCNQIAMQQASEAGVGSPVKCSNLQSRPALSTPPISPKVTISVARREWCQVLWLS